MNFDAVKKHPVFSICLGVTVLLLAGAGAGLFFSARLFARQAQALDAITTRLHQLYRRDPFPSVANVQRESENLKDIVDQFNELNELLRADQVDLQRMEAADFMQLLEKSIRQLRDRLQKARIKFPAKYAFGFDKYADGRLPASGDIPRLVQQLKIIEAFCDIFQEAGVSELTAIERDAFEQAARGGADASGGRRGAPAPEPASAPDGDKLVSSRNFKIALKARESAVIEMLNLMARRPMFMIVTRIEMTNPSQEYTSGAAAPAADGLSAGERKIVLGREELDVKLEVDVCRFAPSLAPEEVEHP